MLTPRTIVLLATLLAAPSFASAQSYLTVETGSRVRLWTPAAETPIVGKIIRQDASTLTVKVDGEKTARAITRDDVRLMELGRHRSWAATIAWGTLAGGVIGFAGGYLQGDDKTGPLKLDAGTKGVILGMLGLPVGFLTGLVIGPGQEHWTEVGSHTTTTLAPVVTGNRLGLAGSVRW